MNISGKDLLELVDDFHGAYLLIDDRERKKLYKSEVMIEFSEKVAPGLFIQIQSLLVSKRCRSSEHQRSRTSQRTVSILHQIVFFRNEVNLR